jgi:hypothetical protein
VSVERGPLGLVITIEELLGRKCSAFGLESREYGHRDLLCNIHRHLYHEVNRGPSVVHYMQGVPGGMCQTSGGCSLW